MLIHIQNSLSCMKTLLELVKDNALNCCGKLDYNKYGNKDSKGFEPCSDIFIDNFIMEILVPEYLVENGKYTEVSAMTSCLWAVLRRENLSKAKPNTIKFCKYVGVPPAKMVEKMPFRNSKTACTSYYSQQFKIACADEPFDVVMEFLRKKNYKIRGFFLKDIDITQDFSGSFKKDEVIEHMLQSPTFRMQGDSDSFSNMCEFTILENDSCVGLNCLTYCGSFENNKVRCKLYNKMVQMLEAKAVRDRIGNHWFNWASQRGTRLASARNQSTERGLTRIECTVYCGDNIPSNEYLMASISKILTKVPKPLVYSTPFSAAWTSFCECFMHSLVVVHTAEDTAIVAYAFNEVTGKVCGHLINEYSKNKNWILGNLTLRGTLPIDLISVTNCTDTQSTGPDSTIVDITSQRMFKFHKNYTDVVRTRLVHAGSCFSTDSGEHSEIAAKLKTSGMIPHENCCPDLSLIHANSDSYVDIDFQIMGEIEVEVSSLKKDCLHSKTVLRKIRQQDVVKQIGEQRKIIATLLVNRKKDLEHMNFLKDACAKRNSVRLADLLGCSRNIVAIRELESPFGKKYVLILSDNDGKLNNCQSNESIEKCVSQLVYRNKCPMKLGQYITLHGESIGCLHVQKYEWDKHNNKKVVCNITFSQSIEPSHSSQAEKTLEKTEETPSNFNCPLPYKELLLLGSLKIGTRAKIIGKGWVEYRRGTKLVVKLQNGYYYQAGKDLETRDLNGLLKTQHEIMIKKTRLNVSTRKREAICELCLDG